jgi:cell division protein FtsQ
LQPQQIESAVEPHTIGNFFSIELQEVKKKVLALPWVQTVEVRREWPDTLFIKVTEQRPIMRWEDDRWVNSQGQVINLPGQVLLSNPMVLSGNENSAYQMMNQALRWQQRLQTKGLDLVKLSLSESHSYVLNIGDQANASSFNVLLGHDQVEHRFSRFINLFDQKFRQSGQRLQRVDARYPNGLAVKSESIIAETAEVDGLALNKIHSYSFGGNPE